MSPPPSPLYVVIMHLRRRSITLPNPTLLRPQSVCALFAVDVERFPGGGVRRNFLGGVLQVVPGDLARQGRDGERRASGEEYRAKDDAHRRERGVRCAARRHLQVQLDVGICAFSYAGGEPTCVCRSRIDV